MKRRLWSFAFLALGILSNPLAKASVVPPNDLYLEDNSERDANISEQLFNQLIDQVERVYKPVFAAHGAILKFERQWQASTVDAAARRVEKEWIVTMYGGLARREEVTPDAMTLAICHEIGHHLGGFPFYTIGTRNLWASTEGQADYFGAQSCLKKMWQSQVTVNAATAGMIPAEPKAKCDAAWDSVNERNLCYRSLLAGRSLAQLLTYIAQRGSPAGDKQKVSFSTPHPKKVRKTFQRHSDPQCRLDTYMAAAFCPTVFNAALIPHDEDAAYRFSCRADHELGGRPRCWFKPNK